MLSNMRRDPNVEESDTLRSYADGKPPSPNSPVDFRSSETSSYRQFCDDQAAVTAASEENRQCQQINDDQINHDKIEAARLACIRTIKNKDEGELMRLESETLELGMTIDDDEELSQSSIITEKIPDPLLITTINDPVIKNILTRTYGYQTMRRLS